MFSSTKPQLLPNTDQYLNDLQSTNHFVSLQINMCSTVAILLLFMIPLVQGEIDFRTEPTWGFQFLTGGNGQLECNDTNAMLEVGDTVTWMPPSKKMPIVGASGLNNEKYELIDKNSVKGIVLKIKQITSADHGIYICSVKRKNVDYLRVLRALNLYEPAYNDMLDKYRNNIMVGGIAAAVFFVPLLGICLIYRFRYKSEEDKNRKRMWREDELRVQNEYQEHMENKDGGPLEKKTTPDDGYANAAYEDTTRL